MVARSKLTPKQEKFAQEVAGGKTQSDAYRSAYDASKSTPKSVNEAASVLMSNVNISSRVEELRIPIVANVGITLESHLRDLMSLRNQAAEAGQFSASVSAEVARGKAAGIIVDKTELTGKNGGAMEIKVIKEIIG